MPCNCTGASQTVASTSPARLPACGCSISAACRAACAKRAWSPGRGARGVQAHSAAAPCAAALRRSACDGAAYQLFRSSMTGRAAPRLRGSTCQALAPLQALSAEAGEPPQTSARWPSCRLPLPQQGSGSAHRHGPPAAAGWGQEKWRPARWRGRGRSSPQMRQRLPCIGLPDNRLRLQARQEAR